MVIQLGIYHSKHQMIVLVCIIWLCVCFLFENVFFPSSLALAGFYAFLTFVILYNTIVPISLYVSMEMCKLGQVKK